MDDGDATALNPNTGTFYTVLPHRSGGNVFHLISIDAQTGKMLGTVWLDPTPDLTPPAGLVWVSDTALLGWMPYPAKSGWKLVRLDTMTGAVTVVNSTGMGPNQYRARLSGAVFILSEKNGTSTKRILYSALAEEAGLEFRLYAFDVDCAASQTSHVDCYLGSVPWSAPGVQTPDNLVVGSALN